MEKRNISDLPPEVSSLITLIENKKHDIYLDDFEAFLRSQTNLKVLNIHMKPPFLIQLRICHFIVTQKKNKYELKI